MAQKKINPIPYIIGGAILIGIIYAMNNKSSAAPAAAAPGTTGGSTSPNRNTGIVTPLGVAAFPLHLGSNGQQVKIIQGMINKHMMGQANGAPLAAGSMLSEDGNWGPQTDEMISNIFGQQNISIPEAEFDAISQFANSDDPITDYVNSQNPNAYHFPTGAINPNNTNTNPSDTTNVQFTPMSF